MPTYLTNSKMSPALRARIEVSVRGSRTGARTRITPMMRAGLRLVLILAVAGSVIALVLDWRQRQRALESAKTALLADVTSALEPLKAAGSNAWDASLALLAEDGGDFGGDHVDAALGESAQLDTLLKRPTVYVRGPIASFAGEASLERAAAESVRDAFLHCLLIPPASRSEKALRPRVAAVYRGDAVSADDVARVHRLHDAIGVRGFVGESWAAQVNGARTTTELDRLRDRVNEVHLERAVRAAQAELLVYLMDEPKKLKT